MKRRKNPISQLLKDFFSDLKGPLALLALLISVISLFWTVSNQLEQNRRWDSLNLGRVDLTEVNLTMFKEMSKQEVDSTDWGYIPFTFPRMEGRLVTQQVQIPYELILWDTTTNKRIPFSNGFFTIPESKKELERHGLNPPPANIQVLKHYQVVFEFKNTGATPIRDFQIDITTDGIKAGQLTHVFSSRSKSDLLPDGTTNAIVDFYVPVYERLPDIVNFNVNLKFENVNDQEITRNIPLKYDSLHDYWMRTPSSTQQVLCNAAA